jgi:hypothetical protein
MGSWLFGGKSSTVNKPAQPASALRIQTSMQGRPITIMWGTTRLAGNLIWQGNFRAVQQYTVTSSSNWLEHIFTKAQKVVTGYIYYTSVIFALCYGEIYDVLKLWNGTTSSGAPGMGFATYSGSSTQTAWTGVPDTSQRLNYREIAYVVNSNLFCGSDPSLPILNFELSSHFTGYGPTGQDANPYDVVCDILSNIYYGVNFPAARLDLNALNYQAYSEAAGLIVSPVITEQTSCQSFLTDLMAATNSTLRWSSGVLTVVPWGTEDIVKPTVAYYANIAPLYDLDADDFLPNTGSNVGSGTASTDEPVTYVRKRKSDMINTVKIEYLERTKDYDPVAIDAKDEASIDLYGERPSELKTRHMLAGSIAAGQSAYLELIREQISGIYTFTLPAKYILLDVEDIVTLTRPTMGMVKQLVRITEIQENQDYSLTFTAEEFLGTSSVLDYNQEQNVAVNTDLLVSPGNVTDYIIFQPPDALAAPTTDQIAIWIATCGSSPNYGGCFIWYSVDGVNFTNIGNMAPSVMGFNTADFPDHVDPDNTNTLSVDLSESYGTLDPGNATALANGQPACWIDSEVIAYQDAALTTAYNYDLTTLRRALFGTTHADHPIGSPFCLLDQRIFEMTVPSSLSGSTVYFIFQPYNIFFSGSPDISTLPIIPYVIGTSPTYSYPYPVDTVTAPLVPETTVFVDPATSVEPIPVAEM